MKRWSLKLSCLFFLSAFMLLSSPDRKSEAFWKFGPEKENSRVIIVFVDMSGSTNQARRTVYREAFEMIRQNLRQGDRIVVGTITGRSYIEFRPALDVEIPKESIWVNRITYEQELTKCQESIQKEVDKLLSQKRGTPRTEIINSLNIADSIFHNEKRQKILVLLSDMVQDSKEYDFSRANLTDQYIADVIKERKKQHVIPDLKDVKVYVAGASADDTKKFRTIQKFWSQYFAASGADFSLHRYGHSLLEFEKEA